MFPSHDQRRILKDIPFTQEFAEHMLQANVIDRFYLQDLLGWDPETTGKLLSFFIRNRALRKEGKERGYRKTKEFIELLKEIEDLEDTPDFAKENEF